MEEAEVTCQTLGPSLRAIAVKRSVVTIDG